MRMTIDERARLVHISDGALTMSLQFRRELPPGELESAAAGILAALTQARTLVVNGEAIQLKDAPKPR
jgi:hypothetical protein